MRIFIADKFEPRGIDQLKSLADPVVCETGLKGEALAARLAEFDPTVLIVRSTKAPREVLHAARRLRLVVRAGSGYDNIDVAAASEHGISVSNCPGMNAVAVAELTFGLILSLDRRIPDNVADLRARRWNKKEYSKALGLKGQTLGIIGAGRIGTEVARRAMAFEMRVLFYNLGRNRRLVDYPGAQRVELDDLLRQSDVVSLHVPYSETTQNLLDARHLAMLKPTALLINTSRAGIIDQAALIAALKEKRLRGAGLDVFDHEPAADAPTVETPLADVPNCYVTHHIGASTQEAQIAVADETVRIVRHFRQTGEVLNCVNLRSAGGTCMMIVRLRNKPGGLAHVFQHIAEAEVNAEEMDHVVYEGGQSAVAYIRLNHAPPPPVVERIRTGHPNILGVDIVAVD